MYLFVQYESVLSTCFSCEIYPRSCPFLNCSTEMPFLNIFSHQGNMEYSVAVEEVCTYCKGTICKFLPWCNNCVFLVLNSSPSDGQVFVLILVNHPDDLFTLKWHLAQAWFTQCTWSKKKQCWWTPFGNTGFIVFIFASWSYCFLLLAAFLLILLFLIWYDFPRFDLDNTTHFGPWHLE